MDITVETINQQLSILNNKDESSETIPKGSTLEIMEAVSTSASNVGGKDIVQKSKAFKKYIDIANQMFNYKFDYSKFIYINAKIKGIIICPIHGEYFQNMDKHTAKNSKGCPQCWNENRPYPEWLTSNKKQIVPYENFAKKANKIFQNKYFYDEASYKGMSSKMTIICKLHGEFRTTPSNFLNSTVGCPICARKSAMIKMTKSYEKFIEQSKIIHDNKYEYLEENINTYVNKKSIVKIKCPIHGIFNKKAQKHISGQGCFKCSIEHLIKNNILVGGYSESLFVEKPFLKNRNAYLYLLKINNFYKIGITTTNVKNRIKGLKSKAKKYNESLDIQILKIKNDTLYNCFKLEQQILKDNSSERLFKNWSTELLKNIEIEKYF